MTSPYTSIEQQASYGIGLQLGQQLKANPIEGLDVDAVKAGIEDMLTGKGSQLDNDTLRNALNEIEQRMRAARAEQNKTLAADGEKFLEDNAKRSEIQVTESGLQYEVLEAGDGDVPTASSTVRTHYHGTFINGDVFDSSYERGQPAEFPVGGVIKGWTEALQKMPVGSKWRLYVPYQLAYGEQGAGGSIPPFSALIFDVELLDIV